MNVTTQQAKTTARWLTLRRAIAAAFTAALTVTGLLPLLGASAASAATTVTGVTATVSNTTSSATNVIYTIGFTTSSSGALTATSGTITVSGPTGTVLPSTASSYTVNPAGAGAVAASSVTTINSGTTAIITTPVAVGNSTAVSLVIAGVTNPPSGTYTVSLATSSDTTLATSTPSFTVGSSVSSVTGPSPSNATLSQPSAYTVGFTTSATGSLVGGSGTITVTVPTTTGTTFTLPTTAGAYFVNGVAATTISGNTTTETITVPTIDTIAANSKVTLLIEKVGNTSVSGNYTFTVSTSSDGAPSTTPSFSIGTAITALTVTASPSTQGATGSLWTAAFTATTALTGGTSTITLVAPTGTTLPTAAASYSVQGVSAASVNVAGTVVTVTVPSGVNVLAAGTATLSIAGVTNPSTATGIALVATSSDTALVPATAIVFSTAVTGLTVSATNLIATVDANYTVSFTATTGITAGTASAITICEPTAFTPEATAGDYTIASGSGGAAVAVGTLSALITGAGTACGASASGYAMTLPASINGGLGVLAGQTVTVTVSPQLNPAAGTYTFSVLTSADAGAVTSASFTVVADTNITGTVVTHAHPTVTLTSHVASASSAATISFYNTVAIPASAAIVVTYPAGGLPAVTATNYTINGSACAAAGLVCLAPTLNSATQVTIPLAASAIAAATSDTIVLGAGGGATGVTNPASAGTYSATVMVGALSAVSTRSFIIGTPTSSVHSLTPTVAAIISGGGAANVLVNTTTTSAISGSDPAGETVTLTTTAGAVQPFTGLVVDLNGITAASAGVGGSGTSGAPWFDTITVPAAVYVAAGGTLNVSVMAFPLPAAGTYQFGLWTSSDANGNGGAITAQANGSFTSAGNTAVSATGLTSPVTGATGGTSTYSFSFTVTTAMTASSTIVVNAAGGTVFPAAASDYTVAGVQEASAPTVVNGGATAILAIPSGAVGSVGAAAVVHITISGVTNPKTIGTDALIIYTSNDPVPVATPTYVISTGVTNLTGPSADTAINSSTTSVYTVSFTTTTAILNVGNIVVTAPSGTTLGTSDIVNGYAETGVDTGSGTIDTIPVAAVYGGAGIPAGTSVWIALPATTNPATPASGLAIVVSTSGDAATVTGSPYSIVSGVTTPTVSLSSNVAESLSTYTIGFTVSSSGALASGSGTISAAFPSGTKLSASASSYAVNGVVASSVTVTGTTATITVGSAIVASQAVSLAASGVTNAPPGSGLSVVIWTSADVTPMPSAGFTLVAPPVPTISAITPNTGATAGGTSVTVTGTGFTTGTVVDFGAVPASAVTVGSATSLTVTSPSQAAGAVFVTVTTIGGTSTGSSGSTFTYTAPLPTVTAISPTTGGTNGGTSVTITGTGLTAATAVSFGTTSSTSISVKSDTSVVAVSPAEAAGTVDITVTTAGGTSAKSAADQFTYAPIPAPTVTSVSPGGGNIAGGQTVTVTGTNLTGATGVMFGKTAGTSVTVASATSLTVVAPAEAAGTVDVTVTTGGGTSATSALDEFTYSSCAIPTVTAVSPATGPAGGGTSVTVTGTGFEVAGSPATCVLTDVMFGTTVGTAMNVTSATAATITSPAGTGTVDITVTGPGGTSATSSADQFTYAAPAPTNGFFTLGSNGKVYDYGNAMTGIGDASNLRLAAPTISMAVTPDGKGYWLLGQDGGIFAYGDATFQGSSGQINPSQPAGGSNSFIPARPLVGIVSTADGKGYWMVGEDGGVFAFGDATFVGSSGQISPTKPAGGSNSFVPNASIVNITPTADGKGYWMVAEDGGVFSFGDAGYYGSSGQINPAQPAGGTNSFKPAEPIQSMIPSVDDKGYLMIAADGGVFAFGDAPFLGSPVGGLSTPNSVVDIALTPSGNGYWVAGSDASVYSFGDGKPTPTIEGSPPTSSAGIVAIAAS